MTIQIKNISNLLLNFYQGRCWIGLNDLIVAIGSCSNQNEKHKIQMEDSDIVLENFGKIHQSLKKMQLFNI